MLLGYLLWWDKYYILALIIHKKILIFLPRIEIHGYFREVPTRCYNAPAWRVGTPQSQKSSAGTFLLIAHGIYPWAKIFNLLVIS